MSANTEFERLDLVEKQKLEKLLSLIDLDSDLLTIAINEPTDGQVLTYDGTASKWKNADASGGGGSFVVTITKNDDVYSADKAVAEIATAYASGLVPIVIYEADAIDNVYQLSMIGNYAVFTHFVVDQYGFSGSSFYVWDDGTVNYEDVNYTANND